MTRKPYKVTARATTWNNADGTSEPIVKLFGGTRGSIAVDYSQIPALIAQLEKLQQAHEIQRLVDGLVIDE